jgi:hypothetical protein
MVGFRYEEEDGGEKKGSCCPSVSQVPKFSGDVIFSNKSCRASALIA